MTNSDPWPSPGADHEGQPSRGAAPSVPWANLLAIAACFGVVLLSGVPITRGLTAWVERRTELLQRRAGVDDAYSYFFGDHELERQLYTALYLSTHHGDELDVEALEQSLVELGPEVVPLLLAVLSGDVKLLPGSPPPGMELGPRDQERVLPNRDVLLEGALGRFDAGRVYGPLERWTRSDASVGQRLIAARILTGLKDPRAPTLLLQILSNTPSSELRRPHIRAHFERTIAGVLDRHPEGIELVRGELEDLELGVLELIVQAMPLGRSGAGLDLILELLEREPQLAPAVLGRISVLAESAQGDVLDDTLWQLQWLVDNADWEVRRGAAVALGNLQDPNSCPQLIRMLGDSERRVSKAALWALREMSSRNFPADPGLWQGWYEQERAWFEGPCVDLEDDLQSEDLASVINAVGLLCHRPLFKNHMAVTLSSLLWNADPELVQVVCAALEQIKSPRAVPLLVERLAFEEDEATEAVRRALHALTGLDLPPEHETWFAALGL